MFRRAPTEMERLGLVITRDVNAATLVEHVPNEIIPRAGGVVGRSEAGSWSRV